MQLSFQVNDTLPLLSGISEKVPRNVLKASDNFCISWQLFIARNAVFCSDEKRARSYTYHVLQRDYYDLLFAYGVLLGTKKIKINRWFKTTTEGSDILVRSWRQKEDRPPLHWLNADGNGDTRNQQRRLQLEWSIGVDSWDRTQWTALCLSHANEVLSK